MCSTLDPLLATGTLGIMATNGQLRSRLSNYMAVRNHGSARSRLLRASRARYGTRMPLIAGGQAPYTPTGTMTEVLRRYRDRGLPNPLTTEVLERAGVPETLSQRTLQAMKLLGFVDTDGNSTAEFDAANRAPEADYKDRLGELITEAYRDVITFADPATDSFDRVRDAFRPFNPRGQQERMVTLFLGLLEYVGLDTSAAAASRRRPSNGDTAPGTRRKVQVAPGRMEGPSRRAASAPAGSGGRTQPQRKPSGRDAALVAWFDSRPDPDVPWAAEERDRFMVTLRAIIDGIYQEPSAVEPEDDP